jgi:hypothetical protein
MLSIKFIADITLLTSNARQNKIGCKEDDWHDGSKFTSREDGQDLLTFIKQDTAAFEKRHILGVSKSFTS